MLEQTGRSVVAVELSPTHLKFVEFFPFENRVASVAVELLEPVRWNEDLYLEEQIRAAFENHKKAESADVISAVSAGHALLRTIEIAEDEENFLEALQWDMQHYLARPLDDYLMDYQSLGSNRSGTGRLYLVAAYRKSEVERLQRIWESAGYPLAVLDVDAFAAINAFEINYPEMQAGPTFLIKADANAILCIRVQNGMFLGFDVIPIDSDASVDLAEWAAQISDSFDAAELACGQMDQVILCGDFSVSERLRLLLETQLSTPLILLDAFKEMKFMEGAETGEAFLQPPQCAAALGLALRRAGDC